MPCEKTAGFSHFLRSPNPQIFRGIWQFSRSDSGISENLLMPSIPLTTNTTHIIQLETKIILKKFNKNRNSIWFFSAEQRSKRAYNILTQSKIGRVYIPVSISASTLEEKKSTVLKLGHF